MSASSAHLDNRARIAIAAVAMVLLLTILFYARSSTSCPHVPQTLSAEWTFLGNYDGTLVYSVPADSRCLSKSIAGAYGHNVYQLLFIEYNIPQLHLPQFPAHPASLYSVLVHDPKCGPESYIIAFDGNHSLVYVGAVPINPQIREFNAESSLCAWASDRFNNIVSASEVSSNMGGVLVRQCYLQVNSEYSSFLAVVGKEGNFVGILGAARVYRFPDHITANVVPPEGNGPVGVIVYRPEVSSSEANTQK